MSAAAVRVFDFRLIGKNGLAGIVSVEFEIGLRLLDLPVFAAGRDGPWVGLPRRPSLDRERHQRIGADGKPAFEPVAEWADRKTADRKTADRFSAAVVEAIRAAHPDAFAGGAP